MTTAEEEPEPNRTAGGCVLAVVAVVPVAVVFAAAPDAGVLTVWGLVVVACGWQYRRGASDSSATPPPVAVPLPATFSQLTALPSTASRGAQKGSPAPSTQCARR